MLYGTASSHSPGIRGPPAACLTRCSDSGPGWGWRRTSNRRLFCVWGVQATNPRVTFPPFLPAQALLGPPRRVLPIGAVPPLPSLPPGCNSSQSRCWISLLAWDKSTLYHSSTPTLLQLLPSKWQNHRHLATANSSTLVLYLVSPLSSSVVQARIPCWKFHLESHTRSFQKLHNGNDRPRFRSAPHQRHISKLLRLCESTSPRVLFEQVNLTCVYPNFPWICGSPHILVCPKKWSD